MRGLLVVGMGLLILQTTNTFKYFSETEFMEPGFDFSVLDLLEVVEQPAEDCPAVTDIIKTFRYPMVDEDGDLVNTTVDVMEKRVEKGVLKFRFADKRNPEQGETGEFVTHPHLNCYNQDDPQLLQSVKSDLLDPPSPLPYNFKTKKFPFGDGQPMMLDQRIFQEQTKGGFFIEAGAFDGEKESTSLYFELKHGWTGLLVEPMLVEYKNLREVNRKAWSVNTCLSPKTKPTNVLFSLNRSSNLTGFGIVADYDVDQDAVEMQCIPLSTLILALGNPRVDFLSLDIEGAEFDVLNTIMWDRIDIRAISVETQFVDVFDVSVSQVHQLLESKGFLFLDYISRESVFVQMPRQDLNLPKRNLPTQSYRMSLKEQLTRTSYPLPGRICLLMNVPTERLASFCKEQFPLDFYRNMDITTFPECLTTTQCRYTLAAVLESFKYGVGWKLFLSDSCQFLIANVRNII